MMMVAMVFMVPMALMHMPSIVVMVVMRMAPVSPRIRRPLPHSRNPDIVPMVGSPVAINPDIAFARYRRASLIADRWRRCADRN